MKSREHRRIILFVLTPVAVAALLGCAPPFSRELMQSVDPTVSFMALKNDPQKFLGKRVMLGGVIISTTNTNEGTTIEMLQNPLDGSGRPKGTDETQGRFLVTTKEFLDGAVFARGRLLTVIGEVRGKSILPLGEVEYAYPVLAAKALHLWEPSGGTRVQFGIGLWHQF